MNLDDYEESDLHPLSGCHGVKFKCRNGHSATAYSADPYYPDWLRCQECGELMEREDRA